MGPGTKALKGRTQRSMRVGDWRIIYYIDRTRGTVEIDAIGPGSQVYRDL